jgi:Ca-activated chloride channel homolog
MSIRFAVLAAFLFLLTLVPLHAEEGSRVILVLDASGSMRGKIDGKTKMDIAKEVVAKLVADWKPDDELGLVAYGHREKGSCTDIEVLREPGALDAGDYMKAVNALNPKGKTPMTAAVRIAAEALQYTEKKATVILVSDGIETCLALVSRFTRWVLVWMTRALLPNSNVSLKRPAARFPPQTTRRNCKRL